MASIHSEYLKTLSDIEKHQLLLELAEPYDMNLVGSTLHMCYMCSHKEYEKSGLPTSRYFYKCMQYHCDAEFCEKCIDHSCRMRLNNDYEVIDCTFH